MALLMMITTIVTGVNILLILGLLFVYSKNYMKMKSVFTAGLLIFALLFFLQNVVSFYFYVTMMPIYVQNLEMQVFIFTVLEALAFAVLNYITWK